MDKNGKAKMNAGVIVVVLIIAFMFFSFRGASAEGEGMLSLRLYDKSGNLIQSGAIITGPEGTAEGVGTFGVDVNVKNVGETTLSCSLSGLNPSTFNNAVTKTTKQISPGQTVSWQSVDMNADSFSGQITFQVSVTCTYSVGTQTRTVGPKMGSLTLNIQPDSSGDFIVEVVDDIGTGTGGGSVCGNGVCESGESSGTCSQDCSVGNNVVFRTGLISYDYTSTCGSDSTKEWIAYSDSCGGTLTTYRRISRVTSSAGTCDGKFGSSDRLLQVPYQRTPRTTCEIESDSSGTNPAYLYDCPERGSGYKCVCENGPTSAEGYSYAYYAPDSTKGISSPTSVDPLLEVAC